MLSRFVVLCVACSILGLAPGAIGQIVQEAYLKAHVPGEDERFGASVAVWGDTLVVAASWEDSGATGVNGNATDDSAFRAGAVYVFVRDGDGWHQQAYVKASNTDANDIFGASVAICEDTLVVGAWGEQSSATGVNGDQGINGPDDAGAAYVFVRDGTTWSQQAYLKASNTDPGDWFGYSVAIDGDTIVVSAPREDSDADGVDGDQTDDSAPSAGAAYVFVRDGATWSQQAYLKASNSDAQDSFAMVDICGDTLVVGASGEDSGSSGVNGSQGNDDGFLIAGAVYVFVRDGETWSQQAYIKSSNPDQVDQFGDTVAIDGNTLVAGAPGEDSNATGVDGDQDDDSSDLAGAAYVFMRDGEAWSQQAYLKSADTVGVGLLVGDRFGSGATVSGDTVVVGAYLEDSNATGVGGDPTDNSIDGSGAAYVFTRSGETWSPQAYLKSSNPGVRDGFGLDVALMGQTLLVGAQFESSSASGVDGEQDDDSLQWAGAAYVFDTSAAECFLVVGDGPGDATFFELDHLFQTQLDGVVDAYEVLIDDIPEFVVPQPGPVTRGQRAVSAQVGGAALGGGAAPVLPEPGETPSWMQDGTFAVQVLMWNPEVFPDLPEQYTAGLYVTVQPDGSVLTTPFGNDLGGMQTWVETDVNAAGQEVLRFPFSIPGLQP